jgi:hypothetical protein
MDSPNCLLSRPEPLIRRAAAALERQLSCHPADWDQAEADRILASLRDDLTRAERAHPGGRFPGPLANVVADGIALCEDHIRNHRELAAQGWDPAEYLLGQARLTLALARGERQGRENCTRGEGASEQRPPGMREWQPGPTA